MKVTEVAVPNHGVSNLQEQQWDGEWAEYGAYDPSYAEYAGGDMPQYYQQVHHTRPHAPPVITSPLSRMLHPALFRCPSFGKCMTPLSLSALLKNYMDGNMGVVEDCVPLS